MLPVLHVQVVLDVADLPAEVTAILDQEATVGIYV